MPSVAKDKQDRNNEAYLVHKLGSQVATGAIKSVVNALKSVSEYQVYLSRYTQNSMDPVFGAGSSFFYSPDDPIGSFLRQMFVPSHLRQMDKEAADTLRINYAARSARFQMQLFKASNVVEFSLNFTSLAYGIFGDEKMDIEEGVVASLRMVTSGSNFVGASFQAKAFKMISNTAGQTDAGVLSTLRQGAYRNLRSARQISIVMNLLQAAGGLLKMGIEVKNALTDPEDFSLPAMIDGSLNAGSGGSWAVYNSYLAREAARYASNPSTMDLAIDTHWIRSVPIPRGTAWAIRFFGLFGSAISGAISSMDIYDGLANDTLPYEVREHKVVSGLMGALSSFAFAGSAIYMAPTAVLITPAAVFIGSACLAVGLALVATETVYDEWDNIVDAHEALVDDTVYLIEVSVDGVDSAYENVSEWVADTYGDLEMIF